MDDAGRTLFLQQMQKDKINTERVSMYKNREQNLGYLIRVWKA